MRRRGDTAGLSAGRKVVFLLLIWGVILLAAELGWRAYLYSIGRGFFDDPKEFTSPFFTTYEEPPPFKWDQMAWYRNGQVQLRKAADEVRIICFGGSTTVNASAGISYPELIEPRLAAAFPGWRIRVLNAGADGYSSAQTLVNFALRNLDVEPDIITVYENINDVSVKDFGDWVASDYANKYKSDFYLGFRHRTGPIAELTKVSRLARAVIGRIDALGFPNPGYGGGREKTNGDWQRTLPHFERNLRSIVAIARAHGIRVAFATQAARADVRRDEGFTAYDKMVRRIAADEKLTLIDVAAAVADEDLFLPDAIHNTRKGVERVAETFYPTLEALMQDVIRARTGTGAR